LRFSGLILESIFMVFLEKKIPQLFRPKAFDMGFSQKRFVVFLNSAGCLPRV
jgi:hypothetical protein